MSVRALIVSDQPEFRQLLAHHLNLEWLDALPAEYQPATRGRLRPQFKGAAYDVVLLDHEVQGGRGLEWLEDLSERPGFPPIVYFGAATELARKQALVAGACTWLPRSDFEHAQFTACVSDAIARRCNVLAETSRTALEPTPADERRRTSSTKSRGRPGCR
jgi:DNA-binding NtrC family response regulator